MLGMVKRFSDNPIPQTVEGYLEFLEREVEFVGRRGERIKEGINVADCYNSTALC